MDTTPHFKRTIQAYLAQRAMEDELFAVTYKKANKNINDCCTYILNEVRKSGCNGFTDGEVYSMAVHYYDEDSIEIGKPINARVTVNHTVELTTEEKDEARKQAIQRVQNETYTRMAQRKPSTKKESNNGQMTLIF
ncbi:PcfK-like family protein [Bacteroides fragilis]|uniref:PcfK-like family protein n=1 Tax=Bacteroides fragilis TaxID=817 RepID=UPI00202E5A78|nr:PcfK-like family protein [Bacteroides fragilis]MCM0238827.1 PcfK-like family protein [Bacteroides fragilis]